MSEEEVTSGRPPKPPSAIPGRVASGTNGVIFLCLKYFSADLKAKFKAACARRGTTMTTVIERFMIEYVKEESKLNIPGTRKPGGGMRREKNRRNLSQKILEDLD